MGCSKKIPSKSFMSSRPTTYSESFRTMELSKSVTFSLLKGYCKTILLKFSRLVFHSQIFHSQLIYFYFGIKKSQVFFCAVSVRKNQSKCHNTALLLVEIQIWIDFEALSRPKNIIIFILWLGSLFMKISVFLGYTLIEIF